MIDFKTILTAGVVTLALGTGAVMAQDALAGSGIAVASGKAALVEAAERPADIVMSAIVGAAGRPLRISFILASASQACRAMAPRYCAVLTAVRSCPMERATFMPGWPGRLRWFHARASEGDVGARM